MIDFKDYIKDLQSEQIENITEHSKRSALEILLKQFADQCQNGNNKIKILHEPKRKDNYGSPDFKVYTDSSIIGYVENKKINENLDKILKTDQIKKYRELSENILLTNYIEFVWIKGDLIQRESLCYLSDLENKKYKPDPVKTELVNKLLNNFLSQPPVGISSAKDLAHTLAVRGRNLKVFLFDELQRQEKEDQQGRLFALFDTFQKNISSDLKLEEFSDAFAQMLVYGLFLAKLNADTKVITLKNANEFIPQSFELIKELVGFLDELTKKEYLETKWIIEETISIMNNLNSADIHKSLSFNRNIKKENDIETDPYIYFYEDFLSAYDSKLRKAKGVYYTPPQVVNFIVKAVNQVLKNEFNINQGLADYNNVTLLDFATGTGTFLVEVFKQVIDSIPAQSGALKNLVTKDHLLKNIFGFEYLIAPYTIAHLKLSQFLKDNGYELADSDRLQIFLTNTLEPGDAKVNLYSPALSNEGKHAKKIKDNPVLVITGNPPYSVSSSNKSPLILNLLRAYKDGLNEQKINLDDDYIKFIRFAHDKIARYKKGIIAVITNNSYLDGLTHRQMRKQLYSDFDKIYIINLHGSTLKNEGDENVFDIRVGVAIIILVKTEKPLNQKQVQYFSTKVNGINSRADKYAYLINNSLDTIPLETLNPVEPYYWFTDKSFKTEDGYKNAPSLVEIFTHYNSGIQTGKDELTVDFDKNALLNRVSEVVNSNNDEAIREKYNLKDTSGWTLSRFKKTPIDNKLIAPCDYRPFDVRSIYYHSYALKRDRASLMDSFYNKGNIGIVFLRQIVDNEWKHIIACQNVVESALVSNKTKEWGYIAPLYMYSQSTGLFAASHAEKVENFQTSFRKLIDDKYSKTYTPEQIYGYIYAVLHSPTYRTKYFEFLKIDFPRIPFADSSETFEVISELGWQLAQTHLLKQVPSGNVYSTMGIYSGNGDNIVLKPEYLDNKLHINKTQYFDNVPAEIYNFHIGCYQVLDKYIKDRKGRTLTLPEITNIESIIKVLSFTIKQMEQIDLLTIDWI